MAVEYGIEMLRSEYFGTLQFLSAPDREDHNLESTLRGPEKPKGYPIGVLRKISGASPIPFFCVFFGTLLLSSLSFASPTAVFIGGADLRDDSVEEWESKLSCEMNWMQTSMDWANDWGRFGQDGLGAVSRLGGFHNQDPDHAVEISVQPWPRGSNGDYASCLRGDYDQHYRNFAKTLLAANVTHVSFRFGYEFDGNWFWWGTGLHETLNVSNRGQGGTAIEYGQCFRKFDEAMQTEALASGKSVAWIMNMNPIGDTFTYSYDRFKQVVAAAGGTRAQGGAVDTIGVDQYDQPNGQPYKRNVENAVRFAKELNVPLTIPEWGVDGDSKINGGTTDASGARYIEAMYNFIKDPGNNIVNAAYFNCHDCAGNHDILDYHTQSREAFKRTFSASKLGCGGNARVMLEAIRDQAPKEIVEVIRGTPSKLQGR